jgi:hypothetical protein
MELFFSFFLCSFGFEFIGIFPIDLSVSSLFSLEVFCLAPRSFSFFLDPKFHWYFQVSLVKIVKLFGDNSAQGVRL